MDTERTDIQERLRNTVSRLAGDIGSRGYLQLNNLQRAADLISSELTGYGYDVSFQGFEFEGNNYSNIIAGIPGRKTPEKVLIIGAHYDTVTGTPGADDNASGVAGLLELARLLSGGSFEKSVRFVAFTLEEPPVFRSRFMGSHVYAESLSQKQENIEGMICLEMIGYFTDRPESQFFPLSFFRWLFPDKGNFITLVSDFRSRGFLKQVESNFKKGSDLPVESLAAFSFIPGIDFSDHRSFWEFGYDAIMVTDTSFYRNPHYHTGGDTPETLDYKRMADVVLGLRSSVEGIAGPAD